MLSSPGGPQIAAASLPRGERAATLLAAVSPWLSAAQGQGTAALYIGPPGADTRDLRSCIVAPLLVQGRALGSLYCDIDGHRGHYGQADRDRLAQLAAQAALALARIRAARDLERRAAEQAAQLTQRNAQLAVIGRIHQGMAAKLDFEGVIGLVGDGLSQAFGAGGVGIGWYDAAANTMRYRYACQRGGAGVAEAVQSLVRPVGPGAA